AFEGGAALDASAEDVSDAAVAPDHFVTLPIHAVLPTEPDCTAWVNARPTPENIPANDIANHTMPRLEWLAAFHANPRSGCGSTWCSDLIGVTGNFGASTDMILRWAACKWGIEEDLARVLAQEKSSWLQSTPQGTNETECQSRNVAPGALNYWLESSPCKPT